MSREYRWQHCRLAVLTHHTLTHVLLQCGCHRERHTAESALVHVLTETSVRLHMPRQLTALGTGVVAHCAAVRLLAGVGTSVHRQVGTVFEHFTAEFARVSPLAAPAIALGDQSSCCRHSCYGCR